MSEAEPRPARDTVYWVVSGTDHNDAGFRIRTQPLTRALTARGLKVEVLSYAELGAQITTMIERAQVVVMGKPGDTMSYLCMRALADLRVRIVVDLFDNYFSWSPLVYKRQLHWHWLRNLQAAAMAITSTEYLETVVGSLYDGPVLRVSDPLPQPQLSAVEEAAIAAKWPLRQRLDVLWFGIGDNPFYHVGLSDLRDWRHVLRTLREELGAGVEVQLTICTNRGPGVEATLMAMRDEGIDALYVEWSEATCAALQAQAHVILLPTNLTGFALSKTHNRCSDALARGSLVLASPHGPYGDIGGAVFLDVHALAGYLRGQAEGPNAAPELTAQSLLTLATTIGWDSSVDGLYQALRVRDGPPVREAAGPARPRVLVVSSIRGSTIKLSRTLNFLSAGLADGPTQAAFDFSLSVAENPPPGAALAALKLTPKAWAHTLAMISASLSLDVTEGESQMFCRGAGWYLVLDKAAMTCQVMSGPSPALRQELGVVRLLRPDSPYDAERWFDIMITLLVQTLRVLGFDRLEFGADEGASGWPAFAAHASPPLAGVERRLRALWQRYSGHEDIWAPLAEEVGT